MIKPCLVTLFLSLAGFALAPSAGLLAQDRQSLLLDEIQRAYTELHFTEAEIKATSALKEYQRFTQEQLTEIHKILALVYYSQNKEPKARQEFELALSLDPTLELDPLLVSPKILDYYEQLKTAWVRRQQSRNDVRDSKMEVRYVLVADPRPAAAIRSVVLPGWGQRYKGEKKKGVLLTTLWGIGVAGSLAAHLARDNAENKYLSEIDPAKVGARFDTFNRLHKIRNNLILFSATVWIYSYIDAILRKSPQRFEAHNHINRIELVPSFSDTRATLQLTLNL